MRTKWTTFTGILIVALAMSLGACQETRPDRNYVQADVYDKAVFQGDWFYVRTVVDHDYESAWMGYYGTFVGDQTWSESLYTMERITWIIDRDYIYAYRTTPVISGANDDEVREDFREDPVAAFRITKHFDVMRRYNSLTGEELNVIEENDTERPWYERQYMRVDWSQNLLLGYYWSSLDAYESFGYVTRESVPFYCGDGSDGGYTVEGSCKDNLDNDHDGTCDTDGCKITYVANGEEKTRELPPDPTCVADPDASEVELASACKPEWLPVVRYTSQEFDDAYGTYFSKEMSEEDWPEGTPYYFSFVTQEMWTPSTEWIWMEVGMGSVPISSVKVTVRNSFLRSPEASHYEPLMVPDDMWDHFGIIRMEQEVYMGGEGTTVYEPDSPRCDPLSPEYDPTYPGCDPDNVIHEDRGLVDFKNYWGARHNIWVDYRDAEGNVIPPADRQVRHIVYYLNPDFPKWLIPTSFEVLAEWNRAFMESVELAKTGQLTGSYDCTVDMGNAVPDAPDAFSTFDGVAQDPASTPRFTGSDCVLILRVNSADLRDGEYEDAAGTRVIVRDDETDRIDPVRSNVDPNGEQMGDIRFKFMAVINTPGAAFSGVSLPMMDPRTGELVQSNFNVTRDSYERVMTSVVVSLNLFADLCQSDDIDFHDGGLNTTYDGICTYIRNEFGAMSLPDMLAGDYIKEYFANRGAVDSPVTPIVPEVLSGMPSPVTGGTFTSVLSRLRLEEMDLRSEKLQELVGPEARAKLFSDRLMKLKGSEFERMIYDNPESYLLMHKDGIKTPIIDPDEPVTEEMLNTFSVMRKTLEEQRYLWKKREMSMLNHNMELANPYIDYNLMELAKEYMDRGFSARQMIIHMGQLYYKNVMLHELGHSIGMEHNFAGSIDKNNYHDEYYQINNIGECMEETCDTGETSPNRELYNCWPCPDEVNFSSLELTVDQTMAWTEEVLRTEKKRDMLGIHKWQTSSIMDYLPEIYDDFGGLGKFDKAYPLFAYAGKVEAYAGDPRVGRNRNKYILDPVISGTPLPKEYWTYYIGGDRCETEADCPYSANSGLLAGSQVEAGVTQKCEPHPLSADLPYHCSNYYLDAQKLIDTASSTSAEPYFPVIYRFCSNNRTYDISWCNMFDSGGSYREVIYNLKEFYHNVYPWSHFRQYSRNYYGGVYWFVFEIMGKINQHFLYRYWYDPVFRYVSGPLGFYDMDYAVTDSLNFFGEVLATPDVGSYKYSAEDNTYYKVSEELGQGDMDIPLGMGKYMWSAFQDGQYGIMKLERQGVHMDKLYTLLALMLREWGTSYFYDERFWFNYYDLFSNEMLEIIGSFILDDPYYYGARKTDTGIMIPNVYSPAYCIDYRSRVWDDCNPSRDDYFPRPWEQLGDTPTISGQSNEILRNYSVILSLALLPFFTDPTYERQMFICEKGSGYCFDICEDTDVAAGTSFYFCNDPEVSPLVAGEDFVEYTSARLHKTFIAVQVEKMRPMFIKEIDVAMELLNKANYLQERYNELMAHQAAGTFPPEYPTPDELTTAINKFGSDLVETESFIVNIINIQRSYGISSWLI